MTLSLAHVANRDRDTKLRDFTIPKETIVIANLYSALNDTKYWPKVGPG